MGNIAANLSTSSPLFEVSVDGPAAVELLEAFLDSGSEGNCYCAYCTHCLLEP